MTIEITHNEIDQNPNTQNPSTQNPSTQNDSTQNDSTPTENPKDENPKDESGPGTITPDVVPGDVFTAVIADGLEQWRVVAVLGIRVLAERDGGGERRSFTLRFVRHRLSLQAAANPS